MHTETLIGGTIAAQPLLLLAPAMAGSAAGPAEPSLRANSASSAEQSYVFGTFQIGDAEFACSISDLKEVVNEPAAFTHIRPSPAYFVGVFNLRGLVVPVIDLRTLFGLEPLAQSVGDRKIAIIEHGKHCFGLLVDTSGDVFTVKRSDHFPFQQSDADAKGSIISSVFMRENGRRIVQVLNPEALLELEHIPKIEGSFDRLVSEAAASKRRQCLSFQVGDAICAIDMNCIKEIIDFERIDNQAIASGWIMGTIDLRGTTVPVIDFQTFLSGKEQRSTEALAGQRFKLIVLKFGTELLSLLVDSIKSIVPFQDREIGTIPPVGLRCGELFKGCLNTPTAPTVLLLDSEKVLADPELVGVSVASSELFRESDASTRADQERSSQKQTYITFSIETHFALDILNVKEVLNFPDVIIRPPNMPDCIEGMLNLRGDLIPIVNPRRLYQLDPIDPNSTRLLIFSSDGAKYGMMVDSVGSIVSAANTDTRSMQPLTNQKDPNHLSHAVKEMLVIEGDHSPKVPLMILNLEAILARCAVASKAA